MLAGKRNALGSSGGRAACKGFGITVDLGKVLSDHWLSVQDGYCRPKLTHAAEFYRLSVVQGNTCAIVIHLVGGAELYRLSAE
jgi:hypothetical protein